MKKRKTPFRNYDGQGQMDLLVQFSRSFSFFLTFADRLRSLHLILSNLDRTGEP